MKRERLTDAYGFSATCRYCRCGILPSELGGNNGLAQYNHPLPPCPECHNQGFGPPLPPSTLYSAIEISNRKQSERRAQARAEHTARVDYLEGFYGNPDNLEAEASPFGDIDVSNLARLAALMGVGE